jgi:acetyl-CoA acyltransferase
MSDVFICDYIRTPIGRFGGALSSVRADDLGAILLKALMTRNAKADWEAVDDVIYDCANQAGEDNRNSPAWRYCSQGSRSPSPAQP